MAADIGVKVSVDGYNEFKRNITDITQQQKTLKSELTAVSSSWDKETSAQKKNAETKRIVSQQVEAQKKKVEELESVLSKVEAKYGENSREANSWREKLNLATADLNKLNQELKDIPNGLQQFGMNMQEAGAKVSSVGEGIKGVGDNLTKFVTVPLAGIGAASIAAFNEVDKGVDTIIAKTGASGEALKEMQNAMEALATSIPTDFETAGAAVGEVNTRFGLMGEELEKVSAAFIEFAELNGTDVSGSIDKVQASMSAFGMSGADATTALDILNKAGQDTGISVDKLSSDLMANSAVLKEMGFDYNEAAGFVANLNKNGLDSGAVMAGMKKALQNATKEGKPLKQALADLDKELRSANTDTAAMQKATELFGAKAAPQLVKALQEGRLSLDEAANAVQNYGDSVQATFDATLDPPDKLKTTLNELKIVGADLGGTLLEMAVPALEKLSEVVSSAKSAWDGLDDGQKQAIITFGMVAAVVGPVVSTIGGLVIGVGQAITAFGTITATLGAVAPAFMAVVSAAAPFIAIGAGIVAAGVAIYKNWDTIKAKAGELAEAVTTKFDEIKNAAQEKWEAAKTSVSNAIDGVKATVNNGMDFVKTSVSNHMDEIKKAYEEGGGGITGAMSAVMTAVKGVFDDAYNYINEQTGGKLGEVVGVITKVMDDVKQQFTDAFDKAKEIVTSGIDAIKKLFDITLKFPKIELPHFKISGEFSFNPPSVPTIGIDWYAKAMQSGMILNSPTIFGMQNGRFLGGGEAGAEVVVGAGSLSRMIQSAVNNTYNNGGNTINVYGAPGQDVRELAETVADLINGDVQSGGAVWA